MKLKLLAGLALLGLSTLSVGMVIPPVQNRVMILGSDGVIPKEKWPNLNIYVTRKDMTIEQSIEAQNKIPGRKMLWTGFTKDYFGKPDGLDTFKKYVDLGVATGNYEYIYVYDELFWDFTGEYMGRHEDEVIAASKYVRSKGLKNATVILPNTILNQDFKLKDPSVFDVLAIDVYPSMLGPYNLGTCKYNNNLYSNLLYCSIQKLRKMGYKGPIWYVYQAFGMNTEDKQTFINNMKLQQETIKSAGAMGVTGIVPFGLYLGKEELTEQPFLIQGAGTDFEYLINFDVADPNTPWYLKPENKKTFSISTTEFPKAQSGYMNVSYNGIVTGIFQDKVCMYQGKPYQFDGINSCLYSDGKWYPKTTPGITIVTNNYRISGVMKPNGTLSASWKNVVNNRDTGLLTGTGQNGSIKGTYTIPGSSSGFEFNAR
jgi:hypothetical protein